jgi:O-succinylhomoserine sulfhydrylase
MTAPTDKEALRREALKATRLDTLAIRAGHVRTAEGEHSEPMFLTSSYVFDTAEQAAARFAGSQPGRLARMRSQ